jgi:hypothetical protein
MQLQRSFVAITALLSLFVSHSAFAGVDEAASQNPFWEKVHNLIQHCAVQPYILDNGKKVYGPLRSNCVEVLVQGSQAQFNLDGVWYVASLTDSDDSDGGDLNDITVRKMSDTSGDVVAERHNALAFGDILVGLAGGQVQSTDVEVTR